MWGMQVPARASEAAATLARLSATAIRSLDPAYEQHHDGRGRVMVADRDGFARRLIQNALQDAGGVVTLPAARDAREMLELPRGCSV